MLAIAVYAVSNERFIYLTLTLVRIQSSRRRFALQYIYCEFKGEWYSDPWLALII